MDFQRTPGRRLLRGAIELGALALFSLAAAVGVLVFRSKDPVYVLRELKNWTDYHRYDGLIVRISTEHGVDPCLVKAVIWRESRFQSDMQGRNGERGLMQVTEMAARDWAAANNVPHFQPGSLFDSETNLRVGTWYLSKALQRWGSRNDALPFALAEYNAGRSRVDRWFRAAVTKCRGKIDGETFAASIPFPSTARYVRTIMARYDFYKRRGPLRDPGGSAA